MAPNATKAFAIHRPSSSLCGMSSVREIEEVIERLALAR
jgi:hypothetical protein